MLIALRYKTDATDRIVAILGNDSEHMRILGLVPEGDEHYVPAPAEREVGYWIAYPCWGKGLTTEALKGFIYFLHNYIT